MSSDERAVNRLERLLDSPGLTTPVRLSGRERELVEAAGEQRLARIMADARAPRRRQRRTGLWLVAAVAIVIALGSIALIDNRGDQVSSQRSPTALAPLRFPSAVAREGRLLGTAALPPSEVGDQPDPAGGSASEDAQTWYDWGAGETGSTRPVTVRRVITRRGNGVAVTRYRGPAVAASGRLESRATDRGVELGATHRRWGRLASDAITTVPPSQLRARLARLEGVASCDASCVAKSVTDLARTRPIGAPLSRAFFAALVIAPGAMSLGVVTDRVGRRVIALTDRAGREQLVVLFDAVSHAYVGAESLSVGRKGSVRVTGFSVLGRP